MNNEEDLVDLYKMLLLDLNPCLQKRLLTVFYNYFTKIWRFLNLIISFDLA